VCFSCSREPPQLPSPEPFFTNADIDGQRALREVRDFVSIGPRDSGTGGAEEAADYLAKRLSAMGIEPIVDRFVDPTPAGDTVFRNVLGVVEGPTDFAVVVASHYDTKSGISPRFAGANDSGSSTGLLLEMANAVAKLPPPPIDILFAFLDGEECMERYSDRDGLHGSRRLAKMLVGGGRVKRTLAVFVVDMVGDRDLTLTIPRNGSPTLVSMIFSSASDEGTRQLFRLSDMAVLDDHVPFLGVGIPAVDIIDFEYGSAPGSNDYWHTPEDTMDKLSAESLYIVGRVVLRSLDRLTQGAGL